MNRINKRTYYKGIKVIRKVICFLLMAALVAGMNMSLNFTTKVQAAAPGSPTEPTNDDYWTDEGNYNANWMNESYNIGKDGRSKEKAYVIRTEADFAALAYYIIHNQFTGSLNVTIPEDVGELNFGTHYWNSILFTRWFYLYGNNTVIRNVMIKDNDYTGGNLEHCDFIYASYLYVYDLHFANININSTESTQYVGILQGGISTYIYNCSVQGNIVASGEGTNRIGIYGDNFNPSYGELYNCSSDVNISYNQTSKTAGNISIGMLAYMYGGIVKNCYSSGSITVNTNVPVYVGGISGSMWSTDSHTNATIQNCVITTDMDITTTSDKRYIGSVIGNLGLNKSQPYIGTIENCFYEKQDGINAYGCKDDSITDMTSTTFSGMSTAQMKEKGFVTALNTYMEGITYPDGITGKSWVLKASGYPEIDYGVLNLDAAGGEIKITGEDSEGIAVWGKILPGKPVTPPEEGIFCVVIQWGSLKYDYSSGTWDAAQYKYTGVGWSPVNSGISDKLTIINKSTVGITADFSYDNAGGRFGSLNGEFCKESAYTTDYHTFDLDAINTETGAIDWDSNYLKVDGTPSDLTETTDYVNIGTVTVTISQN